MITSVQIGTRFKTGDTCQDSGIYTFDGYTDGTWSPSPHSTEQRIALSKGERFPPIRSAGKACYWKFTQRA